MPDTALEEHTSSETPGSVDPILFWNTEEPRPRPAFATVSETVDLSDPEATKVRIGPTMGTADGSDDLSRITQLRVVKIPDDNAGCVNDHSGYSTLKISTSSLVTRLADSGYS